MSLSDSNTGLLEYYVGTLYVNNQMVNILSITDFKQSLVHSLFLLCFVENIFKC